MRIIASPSTDLTACWATEGPQYKVRMIGPLMGGARVGDPMDPDLRTVILLPQDGATRIQWRAYKVHRTLRTTYMLSL